MEIRNATTQKMTILRAFFGVVIHVAHLSMNRWSHPSSRLMTLSGSGARK